MANYQGSSFLATFTADEDLTTRQHMVVKAASAEGKVASSTSACDPAPIGILENDPSAGQEAAVTVLGFTKAKCRVNACNLSAGAFLFGASDGFLEPGAGAHGKIIMARYFGSRQTTADGSVLGDVLIIPTGGSATITQPTTY